jgi:hypothetical protein
MVDKYRTGLDAATSVLARILLAAGEVSMKKPRKYHYEFSFRKGFYQDVVATLSEAYPNLYEGSGICLIDGSYDIGFICTAEEARNISRYIERNLPEASVSRTEL